MPSRKGRPWKFTAKVETCCDSEIRYTAEFRRFGLKSASRSTASDRLQYDLTSDIVLARSVVRLTGR